MSFLLYEKSNSGTEIVYINLEKQYMLAGNNLLQKAWKKIGSPINCGWSLSAKDLRELSGVAEESNLAFLIDFHPDSTSRIGVIEIEAIHAYTYGDEKTKFVDWSPIMLELSDVFYANYESISKSDKSQIIQRITCSDAAQKRFVEFLYLNGTDQSWNWGRNGSTNAAFLHEDARNYFRQFF